MLENSEDQIQALEYLKEFLKSDKNLMIITGKAGTGKTTLIRQIQDTALEDNWKCIPVGVWGRSVSSLIQLTGIPSLAISKFNRIHEDLKTLDYEYSDFEDWYENNYSRRFQNSFERSAELIRNLFTEREEINNTLLVVDEASTLTLAQLELAFENIKKSNKNTKILLIGDSSQLPPRSYENENIELLDLDFYLRDYDGKDFKVFPKKIELRTSHRVSHGPLYELADKLRLLTLTNSSGETSRNTIIDEVNTEEVVAVGKSVFLDIFKKVEDKTEAIYIASKGEVSEANKELRKVYLSSEEKKELNILEEGDLIRSRCNGYFETFVTGDEFVIDKVLEKGQNFIFAEVTCVGKTKQFSVSGFRAILQSLRSLFDSNNNMKALVAIYIPPLIQDQNEIQKWNYVRRNMMRDWEQLSLSDIKNVDINIVDEVISTTYGYAVTIEHAQGGEWDTVGISLNADGKKDTPRYWYTAVTRAKKTIYVFP